MFLVSIGRKFARDYEYAMHVYQVTCSEIVMHLSISHAPPPPVGDKRVMVGDLTISLINVPSPGAS